MVFYRDRSGVAYAQGEHVITTFLKRSKALSCLLVLALVVPAAGQPTGSAPATGQPTGSAAPAFTAEQLEQIAAPVALYPDPLLAQVLMASTYPLEIVQAARFVKDHPDLKGDQLNEKLKDQNWDDSVKSLVSFPQVLSLMDGKLDWTQQLGDATIGQEKELMDAIQRLRARAQAQGNLKSTQEQTVKAEPAPATGAPPGPGQATPAPQVITIEPANPQVVYVPSYNPTVVYGSWPYPAYPPAYPYPPGYAFGTALLSFGIGMAVGGALWGNCNWGGGNVNVDINRNESFSRNVNRSNVSSERVSHYKQGQSGGSRAQWNHDPQHRQGVQYRDSASQQKYNRGGNAQAVQSRENFRGRAEQGRQDLGRGGGQGPEGAGGQRAGGAGDQRAGGAGGQRAGGAGDQRAGGAGGQRAGGAGSQGSGGGGREAGAFQGVGGSGGNVRADSNRGASSRQSMSSAGGSRSGGGAASRPSGGGGARGGGGGGRGGGRR